MPNFSLLFPFSLTIFNNFQFIEEQERHFEMLTLAFLCQNLAALSRSSITELFPCPLLWHFLTLKARRRGLTGCCNQVSPNNRVHHHTTNMREIEIQEVAAVCIRILRYALLQSSASHIAQLTAACGCKTLEAFTTNTSCKSLSHRGNI